MAPIHRFSTAKKGKAPRGEPDPLPPKKRLAPVARTRGPFRWCRGLCASGRHQGSRFHCTPTSRAPEELMLTATGGATVGADGSRRCGSSPLGSTPRAPPKSSCSTSPFLFSLGSAFLPSSPPSSCRGAPRALAAARRLQHPRDRGRGRGCCPGRGLHDSGWREIALVCRVRGVFAVHLEYDG